MAEKSKLHSTRITGTDDLDTDTSDPKTNLTRRSLLSWLGKATVLGLTSEWLTACAFEPDLRSGTTTIPPNTTLGSFEFPFSPSSTEDTIYDKWWINTVDLQKIEDILASWELTVDGLVEQPQTFSFADLLTLPRQDQITDFHCVEGWSVLDIPWNGIHINSLIDLVVPTSEATHIKIHCLREIYSESIPISVARESKTMLAYGIGGATLPLDHGFPLRLVIPRLYGYKNAKWITGIEFTNAEHEGYWERYGYSVKGEVTSARLREGKY